MKSFAILTLIALWVVGCAKRSEETQTAAPDGFYMEAAHASEGYPLRMGPPSGGRAVHFRIRDYTGFVPQRVGVFDAPEGYYVQVSGRVAGENWMQDSFILVADHRPYFELRKSGQAVSASGMAIGPSATVSLVVSTRQEAEAVAAALRRRYSLPL